MTLLERVKELHGPDRAIDLELLARLVQVGEWSENDIAYALSDIEGTTCPPAYTASLDAAVALVERVRPGWELDIGSVHRDFLNEGEHRWMASIAGPVTWVKDAEYGYEEPDYEHSEGNGPTPALALLIALLRSEQGSATG